MANLILWRHAEAEVQTDIIDDKGRRLTNRGKKDARRVAKWLKKHLPANTVVLSSPAQRCIETAAAFSSDIKICEFLNTNSTAEKIFEKVVDTDVSKTLLIVGHQPILGQLIAKLLGMRENTCLVKKGTAWWLRQREQNDVFETYLFTVQHPDL